MSLGEKLKKIFGLAKTSEECWEECADVLVESDISPAFAFELTDRVKADSRGKSLTPSEVRTLLVQAMGEKLQSAKVPLRSDKRTVILLLGVNGVGKTSTAAKLANWAAREVGKDRIVLAAADTFRAAAIDQLRVHAQRLGIRLVAQEHGSDPGAVIYDALDAAAACQANLVVADTAGRLHNKQNLVRELEKLNKIISNRKDIDHYLKLLVLDGTTGSNALRQAEIFTEAVKIDGIIMTKLDSSARGGMLVSICHALNVPVFFTCNGESYENIQELDTDAYLRRLVQD